MKYTSIVAAHSETDRCFIEFSDPVEDYIVHCHLNFYGLQEDEVEAFDNPEKGTFLGSISGYLILTHLIEFMCDDVYTVCDDHSGELEMIMSIITKQGKRDLEDDVFYISDANIPDEYLGTIIKNLPNVIMRHYHSFPGLLAYYPVPLPHPQDKPADKKVKEDMARIIARDIISQKFDNKSSDDAPDISIGLDNEQINYVLNRWNDYNTYPESAKNLAEFERFEKVGFREIRKSRLLCKKVEPEIKWLYPKSYTYTQLIICHFIQ